ncbi:MAG: hypothetical protein WCW26_03065 [Candidatus Buchananbacteria bacterium]
MATAEYRQDFYHMLKSQQFRVADIQRFLRTAAEAADIWQRNGDPQLQGCWAVNWFDQQSTRTHTSHSIAEQMLGMRIALDAANASQTTSAGKGETLRDTIRTFESMVPDPSKMVIVIRHPNAKAAEIMAAAAKGAHVINAGCGKFNGQHVTQAAQDTLAMFNYGRDRGLVDIDTIGPAGLSRRRKPFKVLMCGDLRNGRTVRSLSYMLPKIFPWVELFYCSPPSLTMGDDILAYLRRHKVRFHVIDQPRRFPALVTKVNVLYCTRFQKEDLVAADLNRFDQYQRLFRVDAALVSTMKDDAKIFHPMPRNEELQPDVDDLPQAAYLPDQVREGVIARMALLLMIMRNRKHR